MQRFTQKQPASRFGEAYPVGNGQMGAVVYGSFPVEKLVLTENTFYSGSRSRENNQPGGKEAFLRMRTFAAKGDYKSAREEAEKFHGVRNDYGTNLPVGDLIVAFSGLEEGEGERSLDYGSGIARTRYKAGDAEVRTEVFASHPDHVLVWHMESTRPVDLSVKFLPHQDNGEMLPEENGFLYSAKARETIHCDRPCGVTLYGRCEALADGSIEADGGGVKIAGVTVATLYLLCRTDYELQYRLPGEEEGRVYGQECRELLRQAGTALRGKPYEEIRGHHTEDVSSLMSRVELTLEGEEAGEAAALFQYGRYLLLSSSREDSALPVHLQGIWNDDVACRIGWSCDMHLDINTQMNYWPADIANLSEVFPPLVRWLERLAKEGERTARESYGLKGWAAELVSNAWCYSAPYWAAPLSPYPTGGAWLLSQLWEHCAYTQDMELLREHVYPLMRGAAEFFADYVFEEEKGGRLTCGPSVSAENSFVDGESSYQISNGCTYEVTVIRELFRSFLEVRAALGFSHGEKGTEALADSDVPLAEKVCGLLTRLPDFRVLEDGTIAEWAHNQPAADPQHRHTSHLLGLFPFGQITPEETPKLAQAAEKTIKAKLTPYEQWEDTGWARSLLILYEARLHHGEAAWFHVKSMLEELKEPNGMIYHPPTRGTVFGDDFGHVYELDGNTGLTSGIGEMLLQSHNGVLRLLPAIPCQWRNGHVKGLKARGGISAEILWREGKIVRFVLTSAQSRQCPVYFDGHLEALSLEADIPYVRNL